MSLTLTVLDGPRAGLAFAFPGPGSFLVGRSSRAQLQFPSGANGDLRVSHLHCLVEVNLPLCRVVDLNSNNGTHVNGVRVASAELRHGDRLRIGQSTLRVDIVVSEEPPADDAEAIFAALTVSYQPPLPPTAICPACLGPATGSLLCAPCTHLSDAIPQPVPGYRLVRVLGQGAMGVVHLAVSEAGRQAVALKTVLPDTRNALARFLREAEILKSLDHPHIVPFLDVGLADGLVYMAMAYVRGVDAEQVIRRQGPLRVRPAVRLVCQVLQALEYAHARRFVHRDIKPANLLLREEGRKRVVNVADFGLARVFQDSRVSGLTLQGDVCGTPAFMSPEQILDCRSAGPPADQYATAATLYRLLTGKYVHDLPAGSPGALAVILHDDPVPILNRRPDLPRTLADVIHRAMAREPSHRFADVAEFRRALLPFGV